MQRRPVVSVGCEWPGPVDVVDVFGWALAHDAGGVGSQVRSPRAFPSAVVPTLSCVGSACVLGLALGEAVCLALALPVWCRLGAASDVADAGGTGQPFTSAVTRSERLPLGRTLALVPVVRSPAHTHVGPL